MKYQNRIETLPALCLHGFVMADVEMCEPGEEETKEKVVGRRGTGGKYFLQCCNVVQIVSVLWYCQRDDLSSIPVV